MESKPLVPKLRFPEFGNAPGWGGMALSDVATIVMGSSPKSECYNESQIGLPLLQGNADIKNRLSAPRIFTSEITKECTIGDILLSVRAPVGSVAKSVHHACIGRGVAAVRAVQPNSQEFVYQWLLSYEPQWGSISQGGTFDAVNSDDLRRVALAVPSPAEQQKIASCLTSLDELIEAEKRKLEALRTYKKGLMQNLFPCEGETVPHLRFPEFRDAAEWDERTLESLVSPAVRRVAKPKDTYVGLGIRSHGKGTFLKPLEAPEKNSMEFLYEVHEDDLIVNITFAWEGAIAIVQPVDGGALVSHRFPTYSFRKSEALPAFLKYSILDSRLIYQLGVLSPGGAGRNRVLNKSAFLQIKMLVPDLDEQRRIAGCLNSLDDLITAQAKELDTLKLHKQGLMQGLFPSLDEVTA